jgi:hypothetical protein
MERVSMATALPKPNKRRSGGGVWAVLGIGVSMPKEDVD